MINFFTHYEWLLVDILHVQSHQVLPAAQVQTALILIHQEDAVVAGVEGETEGPRCPCVHQFCAERVASFTKHTHTKTPSSPLGKPTAGGAEVIPFIHVSFLN